ncbi:MAG: hypothetical protein ACE5GD_01025 [Candidatus Geothermarchaeales archaeon]
MKGTVGKFLTIKVAEATTILLASISLFTHLWSKVANSIFPPGIAATIYYKLLVQGELVELYNSYNLLTLPLMNLLNIVGIDVLTAVKLTPILILSLLPLFTYLLATLLTGSRLVGIAAAWFSAYIPSSNVALWMGSYNLVFGLTFFTAYLYLLIKNLHNGTRTSLILFITTLFLSILSSLASAVLVFLTLIILSVSLFDRNWSASIKLLHLGYLFGATLALLLILGFISLNPTSIYVWGVDPTISAGNLMFDILLVFGLALGTYSFLKKSRLKVLPLLFASTILPFALSYIASLNQVYMFSTPAISILVASPLLWLRESYSTRRVDDEAVEVTIDLPRMAVVAFVVFLLVFNISVGLSTSTSMYQKNSVSQYFTDEEFTSAVDWVKENTNEASIIVSKPLVGAWLEALTNRKVVGFRSMEDSLASRTMDSTGFRILTPHLQIDDWEPFSTTKSPLISYYDGDKYEPLIYLDDSFVRIHLRKEGKEWVESPYRAAYEGFEWSGSKDQLIALKQRFKTHGLFVTKVIEASTLPFSPDVTIEYKVRPREGVEIIKLELPVRVEPWKNVEVIEDSETSTLMVIEGQETLITFLGDFVKFRHDKYDEGHAMVVADFVGVGDGIEAKVRISMTSQKRSSMPMWVGYTPDLLKKYKVDYVVTEIGKGGFVDRSRKELDEGLVVIDSFNRILFDAVGSRWVESPSGGKVLFDEESGKSRTIGYETAGLFINKTLVQVGNSIYLNYTVTPRKTPSSLIAMNLTFWIPWDIELLNHEVGDEELNLGLSVGELTIRFDSTPMFVEVGPDPMYKQKRVQAGFWLEPIKGGVGVCIESQSPLSSRYEPTTRPEMVDSDRLSLMIDTNLFIETFKKGALVVYGVNP